MTIECEGFTLEVVKVEGAVGWAQKATINGVSRYRGYHYKKEAIAGLDEWAKYQPAWVFEREFYHNFNSLAELGIVEVNNGH